MTYFAHGVWCLTCRVLHVDSDLNESPECQHEGPHRIYVHVEECDEDL